MSVGDTVTVSIGKPVGDTVGSILEVLDGRLLLVGIDVELDEQEQVAGQNTASNKGGRLGASTVSEGWRAPVSGKTSGETGGETRVCPEVDREEINHELGDLHRGQVLLPPNPLATSGCVVVVIHEDVNPEIERDNDPRDAGPTVQLGKAQESSDSVVVYM